MSGTYHWVKVYRYSFHSLLLRRIFDKGTYHWVKVYRYSFHSLLLMGFKLMAGAVASCALIGVAVGVGIIYGSLLISIGRSLVFNPEHYSLETSYRYGLSPFTPFKIAYPCVLLGFT